MFKQIVSAKWGQGLAPCSTERNLPTDANFSTATEAGLT